MRISYWSADVCSSALSKPPRPPSHPADGRRRNVQHREVSVLASVPPSPRIARALVSVSDKSGLVAFATFLAGRGVGLLSTGGSARALPEAGLAVVEGADPPGSPAILAGPLKARPPTHSRGHPRRADTRCPHPPNAGH